MTADDQIRSYLKRIENALSGVDKSRKKAILGDIRDNIEDKIAEYQTSKNSKRTLKDSEIEMILDNFGDPEEIALNYRMHSAEDPSGGKVRIPWLPILTVVIILVLLSSIIAVMFFIFSPDGDEEETIHIGEGLDGIDLDNEVDDIYREYGTPEAKEETASTLWLSYRNRYGLDFLLSNDGATILEIRINEGFEGRTEEGIGIGGDLDDVFLKISEPLLSIDANWDDTHETARGGDRVLYNPVEAGGNVLAFKYVDQKKGVL
ncbi:MAG: HAAS signaling domain-containing protein, partial [Thermoplasmatota archaeon]